MLSATDRNYGITALHNYGFTVRLPPQKLENQSPDPIKIETIHRKDTLTHIRLPSWQGSQVEPSKTLLSIINQFLAVRWYKLFVWVPSFQPVDKEGSGQQLSFSVQKCKILA